jgi:replicative superfamily II helicase
MEEVMESISARLGLTVKETYLLIKETLTHPSYQEELTEIVGYGWMHEAEFICQNKEYFEAEGRIITKKTHVEHILPQCPPISVDQAQLVSTSEAGDERRYFGYEYFNMVQSRVFGAAYRDDQNLLLCAPTGAGKTDIAMLAVLRALRKKAKVIYIVPMKALAAEIAGKYMEQLKSHSVLEFTGDTEVKTEVVRAADVVVCTPEKFDVATRKQYNVFQEELGLVIIDEIHLLQDDRGPVIEAIVGRIFGYIELRQKTIRIVGLSATLPNYQDVAVFLKAVHVFSFDQSYRPVPLKTSIIGVFKRDRARVEEELIRERVEEYVGSRKQVLVFVHSKAETVSLARKLADIRPKAGVRCKILKGVFLELVRSGVGVHHAGLPRNIRLHMEALFKKGKINILVSTATLAWGVNLPAHAVIIKGTKVYDQEKGRFIDLGILDVLQIFGRAGRPQFDRNGEALLITTGDKIQHYLDLLSNKRDIESRLLQHVADLINAEIYLNTIASISSALGWLRNTFMYVRMLKNPMNYGLTAQDIHYKDQALSDYIVLTCNRLRECCMIDIHKPSTSDHNTWRFSTTEYGRIASLFYLSHGTMEQWLRGVDLVHSEDSVLKLLFMSKEFLSIMSREEDEGAIADLCEAVLLDYEVSFECKLMALAKAHIKGLPIQRFSLICDSAYVVKNLQRLLVAFSGLLLFQKRYELLRTCVMLAKKIERQRRSPWNAEVDVSMAKTGNMTKVSIDIKDEMGCWFFVYSDGSIVHASEFNTRFCGFMKAETETLKIELISKDRWMEVSRTCTVACDNSLSVLYHSGIHECESGAWSIAGKKVSCSHFRILESAYALNALLSSRIRNEEEMLSSLSLEDRQPACLVMTNRAMDKLAILPTKAPEQLRFSYERGLEVVPGITLSYLRPEAPPEFIRYLFCQFSLDIDFFVVSNPNMRERLQSINGLIFKMVDYKSSPVLVISPDKVDARATARELKARIALESIACGGGDILVESGVPRGGVSGISITTFDKASAAKNAGTIVFKGCKDLAGYYPIFELLRICDNRSVLIYESEDFAEFLSGSILDRRQRRP